MPPLPTVPGVLKTTLGWTYDSTPGLETIMHFQYSGGPPSAADCVTLAAGISAAFASTLKGELITQNTLASVTVLDLASSTGKQGETTTPVVGTRTGGPTMLNVCALINHQIARRYRGGKPKSFMPLGSETDTNTPNTWSSTFVSAVNSNFANFITDCVALTSGSTDITSFCSVSYYQGYNTPTTGPSGRVKQTLKLRTSPVVDPVVQSVCNPRYGQQRRRLRL